MYYDEATNTVTIRILYDGSGTAGKTTNLEQIAEQFSATRVGNIVSPETPPGGRTRFFDSVILRSGKIEGYPVRCQLLSVPGQFVFAERRVELLRGADVVVCVCDSAEEALRRMLVGFKFLRATLDHVGRPRTPVLIQANKQDLPGALSCREVAEILEISEADVFGANASSGTGVRQTLLAAIHAAVGELRRVLDEHGIDALPKGVETPESLYERLNNLSESELVAAGEITDRANDEVIAITVPDVNANEFGDRLTPVRIRVEPPELVGNLDPHESKK